MNPFVIAVLGTVFHLKRKCPKCKREQVVKSGDRDRAVKCKFCGTRIPPKKV